MPKKTDNAPAPGLALPWQAVRVIFNALDRTGKTVAHMSGDRTFAAVREGDTVRLDLVVNHARAATVDIERRRLQHAVGSLRAEIAHNEAAVLTADGNDALQADYAGRAADATVRLAEAEAALEAFEASAPVQGSQSWTWPVKAFENVLVPSPDSGLEFPAAEPEPEPEPEPVETETDGA